MENTFQNDSSEPNFEGDSKSDTDISQSESSKVEQTTRGRSSDASQPTGGNMENLMDMLQVLPDVMTAIQHLHGKPLRWIIRQ